MRGDLGDAGALERGARGADVAFHSAARLGDFGPWEEFRRVNVDGTKAVIAACRAVGVKRLVHVGTEAALMHGQPLVAADERTPLALDSPAPYSATKAAAEAAVIGPTAPVWRPWSSARASSGARGTRRCSRSSSTWPARAASAGSAAGAS